jgi:curved DNA-binding protein
VEFKDYYKVMGVARDATEAQIKQAYRKLARKYHPDVSKEKDAEARFKEVGEAYEVLKSPEKRAAYDQLGQGPRPGEDFRPPPDWNAGFEFSGAGEHGGAADYSDFFESLFGAAGRGAAGRSRRGFHAGPGPGEDHHAKVMLDLEASLEGGTRTLTLRVPQLDAEGRLVSKDRVLNVHVPKGILPGQVIRLAGQGSTTGGDTPGDLFIEVEFAAACVVSRRWPRSVSGVAGGALGSRAGREREDAHSGRHGGFENPRRLACRDEVTTEGTRYSCLDSRRFLRGAANCTAAGSR